MENTKKIKKTALVLLAVVSMVMLYFIFITIRGFLYYPASVGDHAFITEPAPGGDVVPIGDPVPVGISLNPIKTILDAVRSLILLSILISALILLLSIKREETPFHSRNVTSLKSMGILLMVLEPLELFVSWIPVALSDGAFITAHYFPAGSVFAAGIVVYCVSLVFEYGISLQKQSDETL